MGNKFRALAALALLASVLSGACTSAGAPASVAPMIKTLEPAVARIDSYGSGAPLAGSGFIVDARGFVLTNHHVVDKAERIMVTIMGNGYQANVVAFDETRDLAMLRISSSRTDFPVAVLGSSADAHIGDEVLAAGFPLGTLLPGPASFTEGIVSAMRTLQGLNYIQTDVTMNPGSSGGPIVNLHTDVIAIATSAILPHTIDAEGIGLAIPIDEAKPFIRKALGKR